MRASAVYFCVGFVSGLGTAAGQDPAPEDLRVRMDRIEAENRVLRASNEDLKRSMKTLEERVEEADDSKLERHVNALAAGRNLETVVTSAADKITFWGELRFRGVLSQGDLTFGGVDLEHDGTWMDSLLRLGFQYDFDPEVTAFVELQGHWSWGDQASSEASVSGLLFPGEPTTPVRVHQAWLEVRNVFGIEQLSTRLGRQEILLGRRFQFGNAEWYNGFAFDVMSWFWRDEAFDIQAFVGKLSSNFGDFNQIPNFFLPHDDDEILALYGTLKVIENHEIDLYWIFINGHGTIGAGGGGTSTGAQSVILVVGAPAAGNAYYHTVGGRIGGVFPEVAGGLDWNVEAAYQFGDLHTPGAAEFRQNAFTAEAEVGLTLDAGSRFRIFSRFLWADEEYVVLYGTRHFHDGMRARYGIHDLLPMFNVVSLQLGLHFDPGEAFTVGATGLWAEAEDDFAFIKGNEEYLWEADLWAEYRYSTVLTFSTGLGIVFPGQALGGFLPVASDETQVLFYLQARLLF